MHIENRLEENRFPYEYKHVAYEYMSDALLTKLPIIYKMAFKSERENSKACAVDRENMKKESCLPIAKFFVLAPKKR